MSLWDRFRRKTRESEPPPLPATPADGLIDSFDVADAVGTIVLASGENVRFGRSACKFEPVAGLKVRVLTTELGPGSRVRTRSVELRSDPEEHEHLLDARDQGAGFPARGYSSAAEGLSFAKLSVTTRRPVHDRSALRALWEESGVGSMAKLDFVPGPVAELGGRRFEVLFGAGPFDWSIDSRFLRQGESPGEGYVGFLEGAPRLARDSSLGAQNAWGFSPDGSARRLLSLVAALARSKDATGVVIGGAGTLWLPVEDWLRRAGEIENPNNIPVEAFLDVAYGPEDAGVRRLRSFGMPMALALPDIEVDDADAAHDDAKHRLCESVVWTACRVLAGEDAFRNLPPEGSLPVGNTVKVRVEEGLVSFRVVGYTDEGQHTLRVSDLTVLGA